MFIAPLPRCPTHGQMNCLPGGVTEWVCHGWDGEGCDYQPVIEWTRVSDEVTDVKTDVKIDLKRGYW